jgi:hypothetical protein
MLNVDPENMPDSELKKLQKLQKNNAEKITNSQARVENFI